MCYESQIQSEFEAKVSYAVNFMIIFYIVYLKSHFFADWLSLFRSAVALDSQKITFERQLDKVRAGAENGPLQNVNVISYMSRIYTYIHYTSVKRLVETECPGIHRGRTYLQPLARDKFSSSSG